MGYAWAKATSDKRASVFTPRFYASMALAGCRTDDQVAAESAEPDNPAFPWRCYALDEPIPFIHWEPAFQQEREAPVRAMAPELVDIMRAHRNHCRALGHPTGPDDPVCPGREPSTFQPTGRSWASPSSTPSACDFVASFPQVAFDGADQRRRAREDGGRAHAAHGERGGAWYYKPTLEEQRRALETPSTRIWPEIIGAAK